MAKFAIGDTVTKDKDHSGKVAAVFTTDEGQLRYAVESEGALQFLLEVDLVPLHQPKLIKAYLSN
jgi:hypothetical protein